jgi:hypothetical protein
MTIKELVAEAQEQNSYDIPYATQTLLMNMSKKLIELVTEYVPITCKTCNHANCNDCDHRLDGWQLGI